MSTTSEPIYCTYPNEKVNTKRRRRYTPFKSVDNFAAFKCHGASEMSSLSRRQQWRRNKNIAAFYAAHQTDKQNIRQCGSLSEICMLMRRVFRLQADNTDVCQSLDTFWLRRSNYPINKLAQFWSGFPNCPNPYTSH